MIKRIVKESGLSEEEVGGRIEAKRKELNDLITIEGAAHIVAGELGINIMEGKAEIPRLRLENVIPGMSSVDVVGRLTRVFELRTFKKKDDTEGKVLSGIITDNTGALRIVFWDERAEAIEKGDIKEGDILRLREGYTKENRNGEAEIHIGRRARLEVNPEDIDPGEFKAEEAPLKNINELSGGMQGVDLAVKIFRIYEPREFQRDDGSTGRVANMIVGDKTGSTRLVLWDDDVGLITKKELSEGDTIKVKNTYVRDRLDELEVHVGRYGKIVLNPLGVDLSDVRIPEYSSAKRTKIMDLTPDMKAEIRGIFTRIYGNPTVYEKDGENRFVVNAVLDDGTDRIRGVFFNRMGELLLNANVNELIESDAEQLVAQREKELLGREVLVAGNIRENEQTGRLEIIAFDLELEPDPKVEIERLLKEATTLLGGT